MMQKLMTQMGVNLDEVILEIKNANIAKIIPPPPVVKEIKKPEEVKTEYVKLQGVKEVEITDPVIKKQLSELLKLNNTIEIPESFDLQKEDVSEEIKSNFKKLEGLKFIEVSDPVIKKQIEDNILLNEVKTFLNKPNEIKNVHQKAVDLSSSDFLENENYYRNFSSTYSSEEINKDLAELARIKSDIKNKTTSMSEKSLESYKLHFELAEISERALALASQNWFKNELEINVAPEWVDIKNGIDDILKIKEKALGLDLVYSCNGIFSERYKEKFYKEVENIRQGYYQKVKYIEGVDVIPKVIIFLNLKEVKDLAAFIKNYEDKEYQQNFLASPMKHDFINQVKTQCQFFQEVASFYQNKLVEEQFKNFLNEFNFFFEKYSSTQNQSKNQDAISMQNKFLFEIFKQK